MRKWFRYLFLAVVMAGMLSVAVAAGDWKPIQVEPVEGYYLVKESEAFWESGEAVGQLTTAYAYEFDADGKATQIETTYPGGFLFVKKYSYDTNGDCTKIVTVCIMEDGTEDVISEECFIYDSDHRLIRIEDGTYTTTFVYNSLGQIAEKKVAYSYGEENSVYTYDSQGNLVSVNSTAVDVFDLSSKTTTTATNYVYDSNGNCTSERTRIESCFENTGNTYIEGRGYNYFYDSQGRLSKYEELGLSETDHSTYVGGHILVYEYDAVGNNTKIYEYIDDHDGGGERLMKTYEYTYEKLGPQPDPKPDDVVFTDVPSGAYYEPAVNWAVANNITAGTTPTTFSPDATCTRAQVVAFLWRAAGRPEPETTRNPFTDVKESDYFYKAVLWASENGIVYGTTSTTFSPNQGCTRAQVAAFLWRAKGRPEPVTARNPFTDVNAWDYYYKAVCWASENRIVYGTAMDRFSPNENCTRAQIVTFLYRTYGK